MATQISTFNNKTIFSDIDPDFGRNPKSGDLLLVKDERAVRLALSNLLNTSFGERSLRSLLFEPIDSITTLEIKDRILQTIRNHEPRVGRVEVDVIAKADENSYRVDVEFSVRSIGTTGNLSVVLERIR